MAVLCIDIDEFHFPTQGKKGLRVIQFDTDTQKFKRIDYFNVGGTQDRAINTSFHYTDVPGLDIHTSGKVGVREGFDLNNFLLRTKGEINFSQKPAPIVWKDFDTHTILQKNSPVLPAEEVIKKLKKHSLNKGDGKEFPILFSTISYTGEIKEEPTKTFKDISCGRGENNAERGILGEVATFLTMVELGYLPLVSKYEKNHGSDGVFVAKDGTSLFLTESKCRTESKSANAYLEESLNEKEIFKKLKKMHAKGGETKRTADEIELFIQDSPEDIIKLAHRVKLDGSCQCAVERFSIEEYKKCLPVVIKEFKEESERVQLMQDTCAQINDSPKEILKIFMKALSLTPNDIVSLVKP